MKILCFGSVFPRRDDDPEVPWLRESLLRLKRAGHEPEVLVPSWRGLRSHTIDSLPVHRFRYAPARWEWLTHDEGAPGKVSRSFGMKVIAAFYMVAGTIALFRLVRKRKYDLLHVHWPFPHALMAWPTRALLKTPVVLNFHGAELLLIRKFPWVAPLLRFALSRSDGVIANSSFTADKVRKLRETSVRVIPYGSPLPDLSPSTLSFASPPYRILFVGRHIERKGIPYLIEAFRYLQHPEQWELRIVGAGDQTEAIREMAAASPHAERMVLTGRLSTEDLVREYSTASLFVLPAIVDSKGDTEGLGVVLIEAVAAGLPIVASRVGGIVDVVIDRETGLLVEEKNPRQLAQAWELLEADGELRSCVTAGARRRCAEYFDWDRIVDETIRLYQTALGRTER